MTHKGPMEECNRVPFNVVELVKVDSILLWFDCLTVMNTANQLM